MDFDLHRGIQSLKHQTQRTLAAIDKVYEDPCAIDAPVQNELHDALLMQVALMQQYCRFSTHWDWDDFLEHARNLCDQQILPAVDRIDPNTVDQELDHVIHPYLALVIQMIATERGMDRTCVTTQMIWHAEEAIRRELTCRAGNHSVAAECLEEFENLLLQLRTGAR